MVWLFYPEDDLFKDGKREAKYKPGLGPRVPGMGPLSPRRSRSGADIHTRETRARRGTRESDEKETYRPASEDLLKKNDYIKLLTKELADNNYVSLVISKDLLKKLEKDSQGFAYILTDDNAKYLRSVAAAEYFGGEFYIEEPNIKQNKKDLNFFLSLLPKEFTFCSSHSVKERLVFCLKESGSVPKYKNILSRKFAEYELMMQAKKLGVNYVFVENSDFTYDGKSCITTLEGTPFARIGNLELEQIVSIDKFSVDYPLLKKAFSVLSVEYHLKDTYRGIARFYPSEFIKKFRARDNEGRKSMLEAILPMLEKSKLPPELLEEFRLEHYAHLFKDLARDKIVKDREDKE